MARDARLLSLLGLVCALCTLVPPSASGSPNANGEVVVTRDALSLPVGCAPREVAGLFNEFFAALELGDSARLARVFAQQDPPGKAIEPAGRAFRWYSVTEGGGAGPEIGGRRQPLRHFVAYDLPDLFRYFTERRRQDERMELVAVEVGTSNIAGAAGITFAVRREADDLAPGLGGGQRIAHGKGEIDCGARRIFVWSMGMDLAPGQDLARRSSPCPLPPGWSPGNPAVACTRGPNARALAPGFRLGTTSLGLRPRCRPAAVKRRVATALSAYNLGLGDIFANQFVPRGQFHPYTASVGGAGFVGTKAILRFVRARYKAGDGWTALRLLPPRGPVGLPAEAVYLLELGISYQGTPFAEQAGAKLVIRCGTGKLRKWAGPALRLPPGS